MDRMICDEEFFASCVPRRHFVFNSLFIKRKIFPSMKNTGVGTGRVPDNTDTICMGKDTLSVSGNG
jgi:hypothetical protein